MNLYRLLLFIKLLGVTGYAGGLAASFLASQPHERKRAAHRLASPALLVTWAAGFALASRLGLPLTELWLLAGFGLSFASQLALIFAVTRHLRSPPAIAAATLPLLIVLYLMVYRPTWALVLP
jgi:hypothetical protein